MQPKGLVATVARQENFVVDVRGSLVSRSALTPGRSLPSSDANHPASHLAQTGQFLALCLTPAQNTFAAGFESL